MEISGFVNKPDDGVTIDPLMVLVQFFPVWHLSAFALELFNCITALLKSPF